MNIDFDVKQLATECGVANYATFLEQSEKLYNLLTEENSITNLTRIQTENDFWNKHVADSLLIAKYFKNLASDNLNILDIGCGAGFPSIVLAIAFENLSITAVDSIAKKTNFVQLAKEKLNLNNLTVVCGRGRELNRQDKYLGKFDIITARAMSEIKNIHRETKRMLSTSGRYILYKTPEQASQELPIINKLTKKSGVIWEQSENFSLPLNNGTRTFVFTK